MLSKGNQCRESFKAGALTSPLPIDVVKVSTGTDRDAITAIGHSDCTNIPSVRIRRSDLAFGQVDGPQLSGVRQSVGIHVSLSRWNDNKRSDSL